MADPQLTCMKLWSMCQDEGRVMTKEARDLQALVSRADWAASNANVGYRPRMTMC